VGELLRRVLTSVVLRYALLLLTAVVFPFSLRHPVLAGGFIIVVAAVGYLIFAFGRRWDPDD
jgi:hypothetical protein